MSMICTLHKKTNSAHSRYVLFHQLGYTHQNGEALNPEDVVCKHMAREVLCSRPLYAPSDLSCIQLYD